MGVFFKPLKLFYSSDFIGAVSTIISFFLQNMLAMFFCWHQNLIKKFHVIFLNEVAVVVTEDLFKQRGLDCSKRFSANCHDFNLFFQTILQKYTNYSIHFREVCRENLLKLSCNENCLQEQL